VSVLAAVILTACGASPATQPPSGIDGLTIPTPSPTPTDFVARVDNPWLPLVPGTRWTYRRYSATGGETLVATVLDRPHPVAGVDTTAVRWEVRRPSGRTTPLAVRWYAQDTAGNVWWFGQRLTRLGRDLDALATRSWQAGRAGAQAGLIMAASPRMGDGYANAYARGVVERRSTVLSLTATASVPARTYHDAVLTRDVSRIEPIHVARSYYALGVGLVAQQTVSTTTSELFLVRRRP
jgi:hypothetical protein